MAEKTTIVVRLETKALLDKLGNKGDTYDEIINRLCQKALEKTLK